MKDGSKDKKGSNGGAEKNTYNLELQDGNISINVSDKKVLKSIMEGYKLAEEDRKK